MPVGQITTNLPSGVTNAALGTVMSNYYAMDPSLLHTYWNDFDIYTVGDWTVTETAGPATQGIVSGNNGVLSLVNSTASADIDAIQLANTTFVLTAGKKMWFKTAVNVGSTASAIMVVGLQSATATPAAVANGIYFHKPVGTANVNFVTVKASVSTTLATVATMVNGTTIDLGWHYDGASTIKVFANGVEVNSTSIANAPIVALSPQIAVQNGTGAGNTLNCDYLLATSDR